MASVIARFVATKVFPAWGSDEVKRMVCISFPAETFMNVMFERSMRKASDRASRPVSRTTIPESPPTPPSE